MSDKCPTCPKIKKAALKVAWKIKVGEEFSEKCLCGDVRQLKIIAHIVIGIVVLGCFEHLSKDVSDGFGFGSERDAAVIGQES